MRTIICHHCGRRVISNRKLKHLTQHYCCSKECQRARKQNFERIKYKNDSSYRCRKSEKYRERKKIRTDQGNPQYYSQYQQSYRASHPDYVARNREKQRERNARRRKKNVSGTKIVNPDAIMVKQSDNEQIYAMFAIDQQKIVNPDAIMLERIDNLLYTDSKPLFVRLL